MFLISLSPEILCARTGARNLNNFFVYFGLVPIFNFLFFLVLVQFPFFNFTFSGFRFLQLMIADFKIKKKKKGTGVHKYRYFLGSINNLSSKNRHKCRR
jgi:hypothetical protein